jgi:hypothetical protein
MPALMSAEPGRLALKGVDLVMTLREAVSNVILGWHSSSHRVLTVFGAKFGLPMPPDDGTSKHDRLEGCLDALADDDLLPLAQRLLLSKQPQADRPERFPLEDFVWAASWPEIEIPGRVRRELAAALDIDDLVHRHDRFEALLEIVWHLDNDPLLVWTSKSTTSRRALLRQHVFKNSDWSVDELFEQLGAYEAAPVRFRYFLLGLVNPSFLPDAEAQARIVAAVNPVLARIGVRMEQDGEREGYPTFDLVRIGTAAPRRPKTLVFATLGKPDMRLADVLDNDLEIVPDDKYLVYDRQVGPGGLRWSDLLTWWQARRGTGDEVADRKALYQRLLDSIPKPDVSPQRAFGEAYYTAFAGRDWDVPALLPEVWLHWDHKTVTERGAAALINHRMDFLLLLPNGVRVIVEVDGWHHYGTAKAVDDTIRGDRDLKLRGYHVWRVTTNELGAQLLVPFATDFFTSVLQHHGLEVPPPAGVRM